MRLFELDPNNPIDRELAKTGQGVSTDGSLDPSDMEQGQDDPMGMDGPENQPDPAMGGAMGDEPADPMADAKPVDSALMARVQGHDYIQGYNHDDERASSHPMTIMNLDMQGLTDLRRRARVKLNSLDLQDRVGVEQNPEKSATRDLLGFVDLVMLHKKQAAKDDKTSKSNKPRVQNVKPPKTEAGKTFKAKTQ